MLQREVNKIKGAKLAYRVVLAVVALLPLVAPSVAGAEDTTVQIKIVPSGCEVRQVIKNGQTTDVFIPEGCDVLSQPAGPDAPQKVTSPTFAGVSSPDHTYYLPVFTQLPPATAPGSRSKETQDGATQQIRQSDMPLQTPGALPNQPTDMLILLGTAALVTAVFIQFIKNKSIPHRPSPAVKQRKKR